MKNFNKPSSNTSNQDSWGPADNWRSFEDNKERFYDGANDDMIDRFYQSGLSQDEKMEAINSGKNISDFFDSNGNFAVNKNIKIESVKRFTTDSGVGDSSQDSIYEKQPDGSFKRFKRLEGDEQYGEHEPFKFTVFTDFEGAKFKYSGQPESIDMKSWEAIDTVSSAAKGGVGDKLPKKRFFCTVDEDTGKLVELSSPSDYLKSDDRPQAYYAQTQWMSLGSLRNITEEQKRKYNIYKYTNAYDGGVSEVGVVERLTMIPVKFDISMGDSVLELDPDTGRRHVGHNVNGVDVL
ncbi:MAG: hypothetical protein Q4A21_00690 [bacterium]|nr:hypothetical protein [bacterium]